MKFINEVVNGGVTIILFAMTNLVCVPKKSCSFFGVSKGRGEHKHVHGNSRSEYR